MRIALAVGALAFALGTRSADAQSVVRGIVLDSLRTGSPVAGAEVVLFGTGRRDTTDVEGRFTFAAVEPGTHTVGYWARWLDSLAVPALRATVEVPAGGGAAEATLATPSRATAQRSLCGTSLAGGQSIVLGEVRDHARRPAPSAPVQAWWNETLLGPGQLERRTLATVTTTDALGMYAVCGVPQGAELHLHAEVARVAQGMADAPNRSPARAAPSGSMSATLSIVIDAPILRQNLTLGPAEPSLPVSGRLVGTGATALVGGVVMLLTDTMLTTHSGVDGTFQLRVPARSARLLFRAVGYAPHERVIEPAAAGTAGAAELKLADIRLRSLQELGTLTITGAPMSERRLAFEERRKFNFQGTFIGDEELARLPKVTASFLFSRVQRSKLENGSFTLASGAGYCRPRVFVDGNDEGTAQGWFYLQYAKRIEVYRAAFAPARFNDFDGCGAVVIWTR